MSGGNKPHLNSLARSLWLWLLQRRIKVSAMHFRLVIIFKQMRQAVTTIQIQKNGSYTHACLRELMIYTDLGPMIQWQPD